MLHERQLIKYRPAPTEPRILIHVGLHKCGSTWLQNALFARPDYGFCAPWGPMSHQAVTEFVTVDPLCFDAAATRDRFDAALQVKGAKAAVQGPGRTPAVSVISHEALSSRPHHGRYYAPYVADRLQQTFPQSKLLLVFREQTSIFYSLYGEYVRNGGQHRFEEFIGTGQEPQGWAPLCRLSFFEYDRLLAMYRGIFGAENVLALPLELIRAQPALFVQRVFDFLDLPPQHPDTAQKSNAGWGDLTVEMYRRSNAFLRPNPLGPSHSWPFRARAALTRRLDKVISPGLHALSERRKRALLDTRAGQAFRQSNTRLAQMVDLDLTDLGYPLANG